MINYGFSDFEPRRQTAPLSVREADEYDQAAKLYLAGGRELVIDLIDAEISAVSSRGDWMEVYRLQRIRMRLQRILSY